METNFFKAIASLQLKGDLQITIRQEADKMIIATRLSNKDCADKASHLITPLILNGTVQELDEGYFANITAPLQTTSQLFVNMDAYVKAQEAAQQQSKMAQQKSGKQTKEPDEKTKKYQAAIKKPEELAAAGKFREAWAKYPDPLDHPDYAELIRSRKKELSQKFAPDMFAAASADDSPITQPAVQDEDEDYEEIDEPLEDEEIDEPQEDETSNP